MDTGCGFDLVDLLVVGATPCAICIADSPVNLHTANSITAATKPLQAWIEQLMETTPLLMLKDTPTVLSIGRRCQEHGYVFYWAPFSTEPILVLPDGRFITLEVIRYIPYLIGRT